MIKKTFLILTILILAKNIFSQEAQLKCAWKYYYVPTTGNVGHFDMVFNCPYRDTDTTKLPKIINETAKKYLINQIGDTFYPQLKYYSCQVVDFNKFEEIKKEKPWIYKGSDKRVKYAIQYYFVTVDSLKYYLTLVFDKNGKIISKEQLPSYKNNKQFEPKVNVCNAIKIAEQDTIFKGESQKITFEYSESANLFVWRVQKPSVMGQKPNETIIRFVLINANSGQVVNRETISRIKVGGCYHY